MPEHTLKQEIFHIAPGDTSNEQEIFRSNQKSPCFLWPFVIVWANLEKPRDFSGPFVMVWEMISESWLKIKVFRPGEGLIVNPQESADSQPPLCIQP